ncbi:MAG: transglutaminase domain-containing protein [Gammaproteobacteria bacterium]|nr:transglutaminase domain-containing protein [Gammaproteobacteria bacterium]
MIPRKLIRTQSKASFLTLAMIWIGPQPLGAMEPMQADRSAENSFMRVIQYGFGARNDSGEFLESARINILAPLRASAGQHCCEALQAYYPYEADTDPLGHQVLKFDFENLPINAGKEIQVRATLTLFDTPESSPSPEEGAWLLPEAHVETDHPKIQARAAALKAGDNLITARRIHDWIITTMDYTGYLRDARGALYALEKKRGDCTEYMHLFVALARANGIPARSMAGYVVERDGTVRAGDFHNWAEFYAAGAWRIADPQKGVFDDGYGRYVAIRLVGSNSPGIPVSANRFWVDGPGLRVRMH